MRLFVLFASFVFSFAIFLVGLKCICIFALRNQADVFWMVVLLPSLIALTEAVLFYHCDIVAMKFFKRDINPKWLWMGVAAFVVWTLLAYAYTLCSVSTGRMVRGVVLLESNRQLVLSYGEGKELPLTGVRKSYCTGFFVSRSGDVQTCWSHPDDSVEALTHDSVRVMLQLLRQKAELRMSELDGLYDEIDYFEQTHSVADTAYSEALALRSVLDVQRDSVQKICNAIDEAFRLDAFSLQNKRSIRAYYRPTEKDALLCFDAEGVDEGHCRLTSGELPDGAYVFNPTSLRWGNEDRMAIGYLCEPQNLSDSSLFIPIVVDMRNVCDSLPLPHTLSGAPIVDARAHLRGVCSASGWSEQGGFSLSPRAWWSSFRQWIGGIFGASYAECEVHGSDVLEIKNERPHQGFARYTDERGYTYEGVWQGDSLPYGTRWTNYDVGLLDSAYSECYVGPMDSLLRPSGRGVFNGWQYYEGQWQNGMRHGYGLALVPGCILCNGTWQKDSFLGESIVHSNDRVYGIDISRWQHEQGNKVHPILWSYLRIKDLGNKAWRNDYVSKTYPVTFCYIKASEGQTVTNKFCKDDGDDARKAGVLVGHYHFMTIMPGRVQAENFLQTADMKIGDLPPMLDVELNENQIKSMGGAEAMVKAMSEWVAAVKAVSHTTPVLYFNQSFLDKYAPFLTSDLRECPIWIARYSKYRPYSRHCLWQLAEHGSVVGINGKIDINMFNGNASQFQSFVKEYCVK